MTDKGPISENHEVDDNGNPAGGWSQAIGAHVEWQKGPLRNPDGTWNPRNGAFVEDLIRMAIGRLEFYNSTKFACRENSLAITKLQEALHWMNHRTADRERRGVEGSHEV